MDRRRQWGVLLCLALSACAAPESGESRMLAPTAHGTSSTPLLPSPAALLATPTVPPAPAISLAATIPLSPPAMLLLPGVPAHPAMTMMRSQAVAADQVGLSGLALGPVAVRTVDLLGADAAKIADIRAFYRTTLPAYGWEPRMDYPFGTLYARPRAAGGEIGLFMTVDASVDVLHFESATAIPALPAPYLAGGDLVTFPEDPVAMAVAPDGDFYVSFRSTHQVQRFGPDGTPKQRWGTMGAGPGAFGGEYEGPHGLAVAPDGTVWVADPANQRLQGFTAAGVFLQSIDIASVFRPGSGEVEHLAVDTHGGLYLANHDGIILVDPADGSVRRWTAHIPVTRAATQVRGLAVDPAGFVYTTDARAHVVQRYSPDGTFLREWGIAGRGPGQFTTPYALAADDTAIYVLDGWPDRLQIFAHTGELQGVIGDLGAPYEPTVARSLIRTPGGDLVLAMSGSGKTSRLRRLIPGSPPVLRHPHPPVAQAPPPSLTAESRLPERPTTAEWRQAASRWLRKAPCAAPCWEGITPGVTTVLEARAALMQSPLITARSVVFAEISNGDGRVVGYSLSWDWAGSTEGGFAMVRVPLPVDAPPTPTPQGWDDVRTSRPVELTAIQGGWIIEVLYPRLESYLPADHDPVQEITLSTLGDVLDAYGDPSHIVALAGDGPLPRHTLLLLYDHLGFRVNSPGHGPGRIDRTLPMQYVVFQPNLQAWAARSYPGGVVQPWQGLRPFAVYCRVYATGAPCP